MNGQQRQADRVVSHGLPTFVAESGDKRLSGSNSV